jgi:hypothetical protein
MVQNSVRTKWEAWHDLERQWELLYQLQRGVARLGQVRLRAVYVGAFPRSSPHRRCPVCAEQQVDVFVQIDHEGIEPILGITNQSA